MDDSALKIRCKAVLSELGIPSALAVGVVKLILIERLGKDYIVWDKAASIRFIKPGKGMVYARFHISEEEIEDLKSQVNLHGKIEPLFNVDILDEDKNCIASVEKKVYIKKKKDALSQID